MLMLTFSPGKMDQANTPSGYKIGRDCLWMNAFAQSCSLNSLNSSNDLGYDPLGTTRQVEKIMVITVPYSSSRPQTFARPVSALTEASCVAPSETEIDAGERLMALCRATHGFGSGAGVVLCLYLTASNGYIQHSMYKFQQSHAMHLSLQQDPQNTVLKCLRKGPQNEPSQLASTSRTKQVNGRNMCSP
jgi:hypothetical protein